MPTSLRKLELFAKVAETEHVTKASELLLLSRPLTILLRQNCYRSKLLKSCLELLQSASSTAAG